MAQYRYDYEKDDSSQEAQKNYQEQYEQPHISNPDHLENPRDAGHSLHRGLSARQVTMIAIGGAIVSNIMG